MDHNPNRTLPRPKLTLVPAGSQVTVTIGRNVGDIPLRATYWLEFQEQARQLLRDHFRPTLELGPFYGEGEWGGVTEESAAFIVVTHYPGSVQRFGEALSALAQSFQQDAIAWSFGPNLLSHSENGTAQFRANGDPVIVS